MNRKLATTARLALAAAALAGMTGCCWMRGSCQADCQTGKACPCTDGTHRRHVDVNVGAHAGSSGVGMNAGIDRK